MRSIAVGKADEGHYVYNFPLIGDLMVCTEVRLTGEQIQVLMNKARSALCRKLLELQPTVRVVEALSPLPADVKLKESCGVCCTDGNVDARVEIHMEDWNGIINA